ncbi:DUF4328 domain-containing protein [Sphingomonas sp. DT-51]|uniref:DUF4328 domain-containing protein n=1 Tax=Sphingomonas sp. DT-51 TaxID=3396165 RepID=UPI003F1C474C
MSETEGRVRHQIAWGVAAIGALWPWLVDEVIRSMAAFLAIRRHGGIGGHVLPLPPLSPWLLHQALDGDLGLLLFALAAVALLRWLYVIDRNAHLLAATSRYRPRYKPRSAVIWFFVPFATLIRPFQVVLEFWRISHDPAAPTRVPVPTLLRWWWGLWLLAMTIDYALSKIRESLWMKGEKRLAGGRALHPGMADDRARSGADRARRRAHHRHPPPLLPATRGFSSAHSAVTRSR